MFVCERCDRRYTRKSHLARHEATHSRHGQPGAPCPFCRRLFSSPDVSRRHAKQCARKHGRPPPAPARPGRKRRACDACYSAKAACEPMGESAGKGGERRESERMNEGSAVACARCSERGIQCSFVTDGRSEGATASRSNTDSMSVLSTVPLMPAITETPTFSATSPTLETFSPSTACPSPSAAEGHMLSDTHPFPFLVHFTDPGVKSDRLGILQTASVLANNHGRDGRWFPAAKPQARGGMGVREASEVPMSLPPPPLDVLDVMGVDLGAGTGMGMGTGAGMNVDVSLFDELSWLDGLSFEQQFPGFALTMPMSMPLDDAGMSGLGGQESHTDSGASSRVISVLDGLMHGLSVTAQSMATSPSNGSGIPDHHHLDRLQDPAVLTALFTPPRLFAFISGFFNSLHWHLPIVHFPTFDPEAAAPELLLAMFVTGATYAEAAAGVGVEAAVLPDGPPGGLLDVAEEYIFRQLVAVAETEAEAETEAAGGDLSAEAGARHPLSTQPSPAVQMTQAALVVEMLAFSQGDARARRRVRVARHPCIVSVVRALGLFQTRRPEIPVKMSGVPVSVPGIPGTQTGLKTIDDATWRAVMAAEVRIRIACWSFLADGFLTVCCNNHPTVSVAELDCAFPLGSALFEAADAGAFAEAAGVGRAGVTGFAGGTGTELGGMGATNPPMLDLNFGLQSQFDPILGAGASPNFGFNFDSDALGQGLGIGSGPSPTTDGNSAYTIPASPSAPGSRLPTIRAFFSLLLGDSPPEEAAGEMAELTRLGRLLAPEDLLILIYGTCALALPALQGRSSATHFPSPFTFAGPVPSPSSLALFSSSSSTAASGSAFPSSASGPSASSSTASTSASAASAADAARVRRAADRWKAVWDGYESAVASEAGPESGPTASSSSSASYLGSSASVSGSGIRAVRMAAGRPALGYPAHAAELWRLLVRALQGASMGVGPDGYGGGGEGGAGFGNRGGKKKRDYMAGLNAFMRGCSL